MQFCHHLVDFPRSQESRRKVFNILVFLMSFCSLVNLCRGLPNGFRDFSKSTIGSEQDFKKQVKSHHLSRRIAASMVPVRERQTSSLCSYEVTTDLNMQRIPDKIDRVFCKTNSCKCVEQGDYRCTQLYTQLNVSYIPADSKSNFEFDLIDVEYACVCSRAVEGSNVNLLEPVLV